MSAGTKALLIILSFFLLFKIGNSIMTLKVAQTTGIIINASATVEIYGSDKITPYNHVDWGIFDPSKISESQKSVIAWLYVSEPVTLNQLSYNPSFIQFNIFVSYGLRTFVQWANNTNMHFSETMTELIFQLKVLPTQEKTFDFLTIINQV
jgi:hypothetical protein